MEKSSKKKAHRSCSCSQCVSGRSTKAGQAIHKNNERKLRRMSKEELRRAVQETKQDLEDTDVLPFLNSPYTD